VTGDPMLTLALTRDPSAQAVITSGLAAYNASRFRPADSASLDVLSVMRGAANPYGGLIGHTSYGLFFLELFYLARRVARLRPWQPRHLLCRSGSAATRLYRRLRLYGYVPSARVL
jgi:hypothetical protein